MNKPYYSPIYSTYNLIVSVVFGLIVSLFLIVFQPFRIHLLGENLVLFCFGFGCISTISIILILYFLPKLCKAFFNPETRTVFKQFILLNVTVITIGTISYPYNIYIRQSIGQEQIAGYLQILSYSYAIGFFPILFWLYFDEIELRKKRKKTTKYINEHNHFSTNIIHEESLFSFTSLQSNNQITLDINKLIYISSEGNYASYFIDEPTGVKEILFRTTLSKIEQDLKAYKNIIRCHKSYIINTRYISEYSGNARGYLIKTTKTDFNIPISRRFSKNDLKDFLSY
ncbi:putative HTH LytTR-type domain-containing protein [Tenacibaculum sp. 190130A14a]